MKRLLLIILFVCVMPSRAAISRDGSVAATAASGTFSATATNSLKIIFAARDTSTTAPSLPAGWTSIATVVTSATGTIAAVRIGCNVSSSSGDTGTGTWTNANYVEGISYSGVPATTTANCATQAIALSFNGPDGALECATAANCFAKASTTVTFRQVLANSGTTSSWFAYFLYGSAASFATPSGMSTVASSGNVNEYDTNGTAASITPGTGSVSSETWIQFGIQILANDAGTGSGSPALVQAITNHDWIYGIQTITGGSILSGHTLSVNFAQGTGQGNMGVLLTGIDSTTPPNITDDKGNSWFLVKQCHDSTNSEDTLLYVAPNMAAGTIKVTVTYTADAPNSGPPDLAEFTNVALANPVDVSACNFANSTSVTAGSTTPTVTNDLVIQWAWNEWIGLLAGAGQGIHFTAGSQSNITWAKFIDGYWWAAGAQWGVYASTSAINPTMTISTAGFNTIAAFFRRSSAGTAPSGMRVVAQQNVNNGSGSPFNATSITTYFPCPSTANLMHAAYATGNHDLTGVSDSHSNTWTSNHAKLCDGGTITCLHTYYAGGATLSADMNVVLTFDAAVNDTTQLFCIAGAATSPKDTTVTNSGNQSVAGDLTLFSGTVTPSTSNGLVIVTGSQFSNTTANFTGANQNYLGCFESAESLNSGGCAANNAWGIFQNPNTSSETWTAHMQSGAIAAGNWAAEADIYKAPVAGVAPAGKAVIF